VFTVGQIALTAAVGAVLSFVVLFFLARTLPPRGARWGELLAASLVVGLSILTWRLSANVPMLNDDPIAFFSPNDWLCPVVTYIFLGVYGGVCRLATEPPWPRTCAVLTVISLVVNVVTM